MDLHLAALLNRPSARAQALLPILLFELLFFCGMGASPGEIPCTDVTTEGARTMLVSSDGAVISGCELVNTNLTLLVLVDSNSAPTAGDLTVVPIRFNNIRGRDSSVTVRLLSAASTTSAPTAGKNRTSIDVVVENCTLTRAVDAFLVDVHNATSLNEVNLTLQDSTILNTTRGAVSVYRSALAGGASDSVGTSVWISIARSTIEVLGSSLAARCGSDYVPGDYRVSGSALVPVLCPVFAASVMLTAPDIPTTVSVASIAAVNATKIGIVAQDSNVTVESSSGSDSYAASLARTAQGGPSLTLTSVSIEVTTSVVSSIARGAIAASGSLVFTDRMPNAVVGFEGATVRVTGAHSRVVGQDRDGQGPTAAFGLSLFGGETTSISNCSVSFDVVHCGVWAGGGPLVAAAGIAQYSNAGSSICNNNNIDLLASGCNITAMGGSAVSSTAIALFSGSSGSASNRNNITLKVVGCKVTATGTGTYAAVSSTGIARPVGQWQRQHQQQQQHHSPSSRVQRDIDRKFRECRLEHRSCPDKLGKQQ